jgi:UDP-N-acetylmuramate: L-alanyl-gamma-D-glutamyl-meso-diaminopimelate ligase
MPIEVFGKHNLSNLAGAKWICQQMGVDEADFYEAIASFKGASRRLELLAGGPDSLAFKDFAHAPSKVQATTSAVKEQYPDKELLACLELHTYSSLNPTFLQEYKGSLDRADSAAVFYSPEALAIKGMQPLSEEDIKQAFDRANLQVFTNAADFESYLLGRSTDNSVLLLMSSGNYGGLDLEPIKARYR